MKNKVIIFLIISFVTVFTSVCYADKNRDDDNTGSNGQNNRIRAEGCSRARAYNELNICNVRCRVNTGGDMWWDLSNSPIYEIPKDSKKHSMFAAALWIGGKDATGAVRVAAQMYRSRGVDFWTGPLTTDYNASIDAEQCKDYDRHWILYRQDVYQLRSWQDNPAANPDYVMPESIKKYPAHGNTTKREPKFLAPFYDADGDYLYNPDKKDYPYYDLFNEFEKPGNSKPTLEGNGIMADQILKGDMTLWWVFNDKGNNHTETGGAPIGLEFRAQAFGFATSDEINDMTFYSYEIINRGTVKLNETYFCQWTDADLGYAYDDYVGCDVQRGLAYCYNGKAEDGNGAQDHYGINPPAIGIDFFQGPYMDPNGKDDYWKFDKTKPDYVPADIDDPAWCSINGINFGDGVIDNERFGMRSFVFFNNTSSTINGNPNTYQDYYNYLRSIWKNNEPMVYGGLGTPSSAGSTTVPARFMFPGDTDPWLWGTYRINPNYNNGTNYWTEEVASTMTQNNPYDRRLMQSAGPFTLEPGAVNYITVGIPWARASSGGPFASVEKLRIVDDKCQLLFINNFRMVDGPDAPIIEAQELDKEIILYLTYPKEYMNVTNNYGASYQEGDYKIITPYGVTTKWDSIYRFEGYQIFQLRNDQVTVGDIYDPDKARLVAQCDVKNSVSKITNYNYKADLGGEVPQIMVNGENKGIRHSFRITEDKFASGSDKRLINNKTYYFVAVAYAFNEYKKYIPNTPSNIDGQKFPYLQGRFNAQKKAIEPKKVIPHNPIVENGGTVLHSKYGDQPKMSLIEGQGNGGNIIDLDESTINSIMAGAPWRAQGLSYKKGFGPLDIKIVDPLSVKKGDFILKFVKIIDVKTKQYTTLDVTNTPLDSADWVLINTNTGDVELSHRNVTIQYEQLFFDYGFSIVIQQTPPLAPFTNDGNLLNNVIDNALLTSSLTFSGNTQWIQGIPDNDKESLFDWIRSGMDAGDYRNIADQGRKSFYWDANGQFEKVINKSWAPFGLCRNLSASMNGFSHYPCAIKEEDVLNSVRLGNISSIDVVFTSDKSKWTRTPVIEMCHNKAFADKGLAAWGNNHPSNKTSSAYYYPKQFGLRWGQSIDKDGNPYPNADTISSSDPNAPNFISSTSMGWFPGYVINVETGERLNIAYSENSRFPNHNGRDMKYNPSSTLMEAVPGYTTNDNTDTIFGGMHYLYVFGHFADGKACPAYDYGRWLRDTLSRIQGGDNDLIRRNIYKFCTWVGLMYAVKNTTWLDNEAKVRIRVSKPYQRYYSTPANKKGTNAQNADYPMFSFTLDGSETENNNTKVAKDALDLIKVVPNPYYGWCAYEQNQVENRVRITNLPVKCTISIYNASGTLIRRFTRDDRAVTYQDWDLKNHAGIPISSGVYIIHINAPGIGEKVVKWFGGLRPVDLNSF